MVRRRAGTLFRRGPGHGAPVIRGRRAHLAVASAGPTGLNIAGLLIALRLAVVVKLAPAAVSVIKRVSRTPTPSPDDRDRPCPDDAPPTFRIVALGTARSGKMGAPGCSACGTGSTAGPRSGRPGRARS